MLKHHRDSQAEDDDTKMLLLDKTKHTVGTTFPSIVQSRVRVLLSRIQVGLLVIKETYKSTRRWNA
jgi:hypothetical protein